MKPTGLKARIAAGEVTLGAWLTLAHPGIAEVMAAAGFDWIVIDIEHSTISLREAEELMRVIESAGVAPLVRLTSNDRDLAKRIMDAGAHGVVVPMINSAAEAQAALDAVYYPPRGRRGVGLARAQGYGPGFAQYVETLGQHAIVVPQIEHVAAIAVLPEILAVPGIDATIIGPYDLSASMGKPGQYDDHDVRDKLQEYERLSLASTVAMGYHVVETDTARVAARLQQGYRFVAYSVDFQFLGDTCRNGVSRIRAHMENTRRS